ncbi:MAG: hypothetical protein ACP5KB_03295 [Thermoprotei archaeon]
MNPSKFRERLKPKDKLIIEKGGYYELREQVGGQHPGVLDYLLAQVFKPTHVASNPAQTNQPTLTNLYKTRSS